MKFYLSLPIDIRISFKDMCPLITGIPFTAAVSLFGLRSTLDLIEQKLQIEGIIN